ncbi:Histone-lysine N-methyltransferase SUVR4 [Platanthera guangdongensis]|uniref:Histone-lysine N-methyltransferase SUVR4 n=1 Tax=Platanthera guangdongensis TaxID=2320717 RepID=A0ABR2LJJ0_9ASPA
MLLDVNWGAKEGLNEEGLCLDATVYGNIGRFVNHRYCAFLFFKWRALHSKKHICIIFNWIS